MPSAKPPQAAKAKRGSQAYGDLDWLECGLGFTDTNLHDEAVNARDHAQEIVRAGRRHEVVSQEVDFYELRMRSQRFDERAHAGEVDAEGVAFHDDQVRVECKGHGCGVWSFFWEGGGQELRTNSGCLLGALRDSAETK